MNEGPFGIPGPAGESGIAERPDVLRPLAAVANAGDSDINCLCRRAHDEIVRLRADIWQPIETAPKDGTRIVVYRPGAEEVISYDYWHGNYWYRSRPAFPPSHWCHHHEIRPQAQAPEQTSVIATGGE